MSTRSFIYKGVYCHSDGYLTYNGAMHLDHYNSREKADALIALGDLSLLCEKLYPDPDKPHGFDYDKRQPDVTVAYARDRGEKNTEAQIVTPESALNSWGEYLYDSAKTENGDTTPCATTSPNCGTWKQTLPKNLKRWALNVQKTCTAFSRKRGLTN